MAGAFSDVNRFCMAVLYGRAGCLTAKNGGFRPVQKPCSAPRPREKPCEQCGEGAREYGLHDAKAERGVSARPVVRWCARCAEGHPGAIDWRTVRARWWWWCVWGGRGVFRMILS